MYLRGIVLFTLFLSSAARRSMRADDSFHDAQQQNNMLIKAREVSSEAREALLPRSFGKAAFRGGGAQTGALRAAHGQGPHMRAPDGAAHGGVLPTETYFQRWMTQELAKDAIRESEEIEGLAALWSRARIQVPVMTGTADEEKETDAAFGASHTSMYTDAVAKASYDLMPDVLAQKVADPDLRKVMTTMFDAFGTITEALRKELVTVAEKQASVFGDVQLGVDVLADDLMWDVCKTEPLIKEGASEEEPEVRVMHEDGKFSIVWDPLDGSSIVDNNWAVGTILGIWGSNTGIVGATGRDQLASMVALYGPRTTVFVTLDDGVYEFTYGAGGVDGWVCSRDQITISQESKIFSPANMRAAQDLDGYATLIDYWMTNRYTLRYTGGLVPDICQQFTKKQGVFANPTSEKSPAKLRLAFEAAPFGFLVEKAGGKTSNCIDGASVLDTKITGIDQRTPLCIGSACEVDRFNEVVLGKSG